MLPTTGKSMEEWSHGSSNGLFEKKNTRSHNYFFKKEEYLFKGRTLWELFQRHFETFCKISVKKLTVFLFFWLIINVLFLNFLLKCNWHIHCISVRYTTCWINTFIYCNVITTIASANTSTVPHNNHFFVVRTGKIPSLRNFEVCNTVSLTIITMLGIISPELIHLLTGSLYLLTKVYIGGTL